MRAKRWIGAALGAALLSASAGASAEVRHEGSWPGEDRQVTLDLERVPLRLALRRLADAAGWSIAVPSGLDEPVDVQVKEQPADRVLEMLLAHDRFVAHRTGDLLQVRRDGGPKPWPSASFDAHRHGKRRHTGRGADRTVTGGNARIERDDEVRHLTVLGGSVEIYGTITGDVSVFGGSVRLRRDARVQGDVRAVRGSVRIEDGAQVDGDLETVGGSIERADRAKPGSKAPSKASDADADEPAPPLPMAPLSGLKLQEVATRAGTSLSSASTLFVLGAVLWALLTDRMERMQVAVARSPMRAFAVGVVSVLGGALMLGALCVTIVGIPVALVAALAAVLGAYGGVCAALQTVGRGLLAHRTSNPYAHLALGCILLMVAGWLPLIGSYITGIVALIGLGAAVSTGFGGLVRPVLGAPETHRVA